MHVLFILYIVIVFRNSTNNTWLKARILGEIVVESFREVVFVGFERVAEPKKSEMTEGKEK